MIDLKRMLVWDDPGRKYERWIVHQFDDGGCLAVITRTTIPIGKEQAIEKIKHTEAAITYWEYCAPIEVCCKGTEV